MYEEQADKCRSCEGTLFEQEGDILVCKACGMAKYVRKNKKNSKADAKNKQDREQDREQEQTAPEQQTQRQEADEA